jgi:phosphoribosylamine-glycine ligase
MRRTVFLCALTFILDTTACAATLEEATARAYEAVGKIQFDGMQF